MRKFISPEDLADLMRTFKEGSAAVWGVTKGDNSTGETKWNRMNPGDVALFSRTGRIFSAGVVAKKIHNPQLARELWRENEDGNTWEFMYFLRDMREVDIPYAKFNKAAGYAPNNVIQGFNVLPAEKSETILDLLSMKVPLNSNEQELEKQKEIAAKEGEFDPSSEGEGREKTMAAICRRQGQPEFRNKLIRAYSGRCAVTGWNAVQTLEAAHILQYDGPKTNHPANGLLLRADIHSLFDLGLIAIDSSLKILLAPALKDTQYAQYEGKQIIEPVETNLKPSLAALKKHRLELGL
jgi:hypothetical protein